MQKIFPHRILFSNSKECKTFGLTLTHSRGKAISPRMLNLGTHHKYNVQTAWTHRLNKNSVLNIDHLWKPKNMTDQQNLLFLWFLNWYQKTCRLWQNILVHTTRYFLIVHTFLTHIHKRHISHIFIYFHFDKILHQIWFCNSKKTSHKNLIWSETICCVYCETTRGAN